MNSKALLILAIVAVGCHSEAESSEFQGAERDQQIDEIIENLKLADFPDEEIEVLEDGTVVVGGDAIVTLQAFREMAGIRRFSAEGEDGHEDAFRQYRTTNLVGDAVSTICITDAFTGNLSTALDNAVANYNDETLSLTITRGGTDCDATIQANLINGDGGLAGFPSNGLPFGTINIGSDLGAGSIDIATHVITHEIGHCIGFRHTDYFNRIISCGVEPGINPNEGQSFEGAVHIPGTPQGAAFNGSVMNACYNNTSTGDWTPGDVIALNALYGAGGPSCAGICGQNQGTCWCDAGCANFGDCCADKVAECG